MFRTQNMRFITYLSVNLWTFFQASPCPKTMPEPISGISPSRRYSSNPGDGDRCEYSSMAMFFCNVSKSAMLMAGWWASMNPTMSPCFLCSFANPTGISSPRAMASPTKGRGNLGPGGKFAGYPHTLFLYQNTNKIPAKISNSTLKSIFANNGACLLGNSVQVWKRTILKLRWSPAKRNLYSLTQTGFIEFVW